MKIKIVEPYSFNKRYDIRSLTPSVGPVVIASLLKEQGHDVEVISEYVTRLDPAELAEADMLGISITTYNAERGFEIAQLIRKPIVFGGFHASLMPEECLQYGDYVVKGDGHSVLQLADYLQRKGTSNLDEIPNLVYRREGRIIHTLEESRPVHLVPDFSLVRDFYKFNLNSLLRIPMFINFSRGCLQKCSFCCVRKVYPDFRPKDKILVVKSIQALADQGHLLSRFFTRVIAITDDNFFSDLKWAREVLQELAGIRTGCALVLQARVDQVQNPELLQLLKKAGINRIFLGIESLNQRSLDTFKKNTSLTEVEDAVKKIKASGLEIHGLFIFGDDEFQKGDGARVAAFVRRTGLAGVLIQPLTPFPGTDLFQEMKSEKRILHERWSEYDGKIVFQPRNLSPAELTGEIYDCYRKVYSPLEVLRYLWAGQKGWKLEHLGEAIIRRVEGFKMRRYVRDRLTGNGAFYRQ
jgi:radical SAM superfamily enzyme YgiQ (UPF0313 family)